MRKLLGLLALLVGSAFAQNTTATGIITDPLTQPWYGGTYQFQLIFPTGYSQATFNGGVIPSSQYTAAGVLDNTGAFSISVLDNSAIAPAGTFWRVTICSQTSSPVQTTGGAKQDTCYITDTPVAGTTEDLTTILTRNTPIPLVNGLLTPFAYAQAEMQTTASGLRPGAMYWDLGAQCIEVWNGSVWGCISTGGGTSGNVINCPTAINGAIAAFTNPTTLDCDRQFTTDFNGNGLAVSLGTNGPFNGEYRLSTIGIVPPGALPAGTVSWVVPNVVPNPVRFNLPPTPAIADGQFIQQISHSTDASGTLNSFWNWGTPAGGGTVTNITATSPVVVTPSPLVSAGVISCPTCNTSSATVSSFSSGNLANLFTANVATSTTTPALTFTATNAAANTIFGNFTGGAAPKVDNVITPCGDATHALNWIAGTGIGCQTISAASTAKKTCAIIIGSDSGATLANSDIAPQGRQCFINTAATVLEVEVASDGGTPNVVLDKNHAGTPTNILSAFLATAASGGIACSNVGGTLGIDGVTTCSNTLQNTALAAGDYLETTTGTAGGTAHRLSIFITFQ